MSSLNNNNNQGPMSPVSTTSDMPPSTSNTIIIEQDSDDNLQKLFDTVLKPGDKQVLTIPLSMRKLPKSFFQPPSHSRDNSIDSALGSTTPTPPSGGAATPINSGAPHQRLQISHSRAHSSPVTLQETYAAGQKAQQQQQQAGNNNNHGGNNGGAATAGPQTAANSSAGGASMNTPLKAVHASQRSYDVVSAIQLQEELGDLPQGWEQARTAEGQIYYLK